MNNKTSTLFTWAVIPVWILAALLITGCADEDSQPAAPMPGLSEVEIGSGNNGVGVIGRDFHLNAEVLAGDKIEYVEVRIEPKEGESYAGDWSFDIRWDQFKGARNATVHQHFDIPDDAVEGSYDLIIVVQDENGEMLEETYDLMIVDPANLPVDPLLYIWMITTDQGDFHYVNETLENPENVEFSQGEILTSDVNIQNVKGDGQLYLLLIKKDLNHLPESVDDIDFSKVMVYDVFDHANEEEVFTFGNVIYDGNGGFVRPAPALTMGAAEDNNTPQPNPIAGDKAWETGTYYFGVVYTNFTHNISLHHYFELQMEGF